MSEVTQILDAIARGAGKATEELLPLVYEELRKVAAYKMAHEDPGHTLQPTALVHEAYLRLVGQNQSQQWEGRNHFFAAAAEAMRRILVDREREKQAEKRGGNLQRVEIDSVEVVLPMPEDVLAPKQAGNVSGPGTVSAERDESIQAVALAPPKYFRPRTTNTLTTPTGFSTP